MSAFVFRRPPHRFPTQPRWVSGPRVVTGSASLETTFSASTNGVRTRFGAAAAPFTFTVGTAGKVTALSSAALPVTFTAATNGVRTRFGAAALPVTFTVATAGAKSTAGAAAFTVTFTAGTAGKVTMRGAAALPITFTAGSAGKLTAKSSAALPITFTVATAGRLTKFGSAGLPVTFTAATAGAKTALGSAALPISFVAATNGVRTRFGTASLTETFNAAAAGKLTAKGSAALAESFNASTAGKLTAKASVGLPITFNASTAGAVGVTYYVSNTGSDAADGLTTGTAWQTVAKVNTDAATGDTILFKRGGVWRESLTPASGVTYGAYDSGALPRITGCDLLATWTVHSGSIYKATFNNGIDTYTLLEDGAPLLRKGSVGAITGAGQFFPDDAGNTIYVRATDSADPDTHTMEIGVRYNVVDCNDKTDVVFDSLHFHGAGGQFGGALKISGQSENIAVTDCEASDSWFAGIWLEHDGTPVIDGVTVTDTEVHHCVVAGVNVNGTDTSERITGFTMSGGSIHDCGNATDGQHGAFIRFSDGAVITGVEVYNNVSSQAWGGGIYLDASVNAVVSDCVSHDNSPNNFHFDVNSNGFDMLRCVSYGAADNDLVIEEHVDSNGTSRVLHNTLYGGASIRLGPGASVFEVSGVTVKNNIFAGQTYGAINIDTSAGGDLSDYLANTIDYNLYWGVGTNAAFKVDGSSYTLTTWRTATSWDANSLDADPLFTNAAGRDFTLTSTSPAVNSGVTITGVNDDYIGSAPDRGAFERAAVTYSGSAALPVTFTAATAGKLTAKSTVTFTENFNAAAVGKLTARGAAALPITFTVFADGTAEEGEAATAVFRSLLGVGL